MKSDATQSEFVFLKARNLDQYTKEKRNYKLETIRLMCPLHFS